MSVFPGASAFPGNFATAALGVFWDIQQCEIPDGQTAAEVVERLRSNFRESGHLGPVSINAYGDMTPHDFASSGIKHNHFPAGDKYGRQTKMLEDIVAWAGENPEPSTLLLIAGDVPDELVEAVKLLKSRKNYHLLYVHPAPRPTVITLFPLPED
ncbi:unnamed protein product [Thlaspi arvense]|uniref:NYN domain-containing protein n=1 Tax=Thlaspi arvense TaxID=13288 RepID=A0AAU9SDQ7_THLAR|nr:unnamed protein product [Thlaspi arvense]